MIIQIRDFQNKVNSLSDAREFHDLERVLHETFWNDHLFKKDNLLQSKEFGILLSGFGTCYYRKSKEERVCNAKRIVENVNSFIPLS